MPDLYGTFANNSPFPTEQGGKQRLIIARSIGGLTRAKEAGSSSLAVLGWVSPRVFSGRLKVCLAPIINVEEKRPYLHELNLLGYITTCYPTEAEKGKYIATSWVLNAMGSVVGAGPFNQTSSPS
jgi:hypothetical protein